MSDPNETIRLDQLLLNAGLVASRSRARDAITRGTVTVNGRLVTKPSAGFPASAVLAIDDPAQAYVSRAALKLTAALDHFRLDPKGLDCLDIGASTGGFTQVLLERGATHVVAVDVGHDQLHPRLREDERITPYEGLNARVLDEEALKAFCAERLARYKVPARIEALAALPKTGVNKTDKKVLKARVRA